MSQQFMKVIVSISLVLLSSAGMAEEWLVAVLSGNARADAWLIPLDPGQTPQGLLNATADSKTDPSFVGHYGNIAFDYFSDPQKHAIFLTDAVLEKLLPEVLRLQQQGDLGESPTISFLYAMAGLDAVDGRVNGYRSDQGRQALHSYETAVDELFYKNGLQLSTLVGADDGSLLLSAVKQAGTKSNNLVIYDDTCAEGYRIEGNRVVEKVSAQKCMLPAGGYFQLGALGAELLSEGGPKTRSLTEQLRSFWHARSLDYSDDEIRKRYIKSFRNELGGVMTLLATKPQLPLTPEESQSPVPDIKNAMGVTVDALADLAMKLKPDASGTTVVKIIGFYGDALAAVPELEKRFLKATCGSVKPEVISGDQLEQALTSAAAQRFKRVMTARYGSSPLKK